MISVEESNGTNQQRISTELVPFFNKFKKTGATDEDILTLVTQVSYLLDAWEYSPEEIKSLDRKAFFDLIKSCYENSRNKAIYRKIFSF